MVRNCMWGDFFFLSNCWYYTVFVIQSGRMPPPPPPKKKDVTSWRMMTRILHTNNSTESKDTIMSSIAGMTHIRSWSLLAISYIRLTIRPLFLFLNCLKCPGLDFVLLLFSFLLKVMSSLTNSVQALYIIVVCERQDLQRTVKAMQICVHIMYEDCREHVNMKTKPKPAHFRQFRNPGWKKKTYGHPTFLYPLRKWMYVVVYYVSTINCTIIIILHLCPGIIIYWTSCRISEILGCSIKWHGNGFLFCFATTHIPAGTVQIKTAGVT